MTYLSQPAGLKAFQNVSGAPFEDEKAARRDAKRASLRYEHAVWQVVVSGTGHIVVKYRNGREVQ